MGIVSYAQNFEDVMLWRALGHISSGFWIDVGAADPTLHSVTRAFAERGWRGINIEPSEAEFDALQQARPNDINLSVAVGAAHGNLTFHDCEDSGLSTLDPAAAARNRAAGRKVTERQVAVTTLAAICREYAPPAVHFLKIDVEGAEAEVLSGADFMACRPWIIVIEATLPLTQTDASSTWEPGLLAAGYRFAYFDGLNRFYIATEHWGALHHHFAAPPNVFDHFTLADSSVRLYEARLVRAEAELALLRLNPTATARLPLLPRRMAQRLRGFFSAELRQEISMLRQELALLAIEVRTLRRSAPDRTDLR